MKTLVHYFERRHLKYTPDQLKHSLLVRVFSYGVSHYLESGFILFDDLEKFVSNEKELLEFCFKFLEMHREFSANFTYVGIADLLAQEVCELFARYHDYDDPKLGLNPKLDSLITIFNLPELEGPTVTINFKL